MYCYKLLMNIRVKNTHLTISKNIVYPNVISVGDHITILDVQMVVNSVDHFFLDDCPDNEYCYVMASTKVNIFNLDRLKEKFLAAGCTIEEEYDIKYDDFKKDV